MTTALNSSSDVGLHYVLWRNENYSNEIPLYLEQSQSYVTSFVKMFKKNCKMEMLHIGNVENECLYLN